MDETEKVVERFLLSRGFRDVVYEPDGNIPPDFLAEKRIAVEVRRLNQHYDDGTSVRGLEEVEIPLIHKFRKVLLALGKSPAGNSCYAFVNFSRPVESWKTLEPKLRGALKTFMENPSQQKSTLAISSGFEVELLPTTKSYSTFYVMGGSSDEQSGGWVFSEMSKNFAHCVSEKAQKVAPYRSKYAEWWLVLVDHIGYGLDDLDQKMFRAVAPSKGEWSKVILINPLNHEHSFEI